MLPFHAETTLDFTYTIGDEMDRKSWCSEFEDDLDYLSEPIAQSLATNKDSRTGFRILWKYLANCIRANTLPTGENLLLLVQNVNEWPPHCRNLIQRGKLSHR
ncbi:hypothetical protein CPSG_03756 [Coccidioides posadasii str. Silveira]|uniref:Uncharacterized protein n=1 Tax=Coccidioides posadasii (strain RMSCC 757 / Silveira) TaxID=443226 RepID=E9D2F8_COCPS|nr:hypothetical protein CPSG_03756 [Coccidioides posadasii str. Silveira]